MPLSESQLQIWANPYDTDAARNGHRAVRRALDLHCSTEFCNTVDDFLQGSYRNSTSVWRDADVDVVFKWKNAWWFDISQLNDAEKAAFERDRNSATYGFWEFRNDVLDALHWQFGREAVDSSGQKAIRVAGDGTDRLHTDILVALEFRRYTRYQPGNIQFHEGVGFLTNHEGSFITNFPKQHIANGQAKNSGTSDWYKPTVRQFKNARNRAGERGLLDASTAPSYFVECLLSNVPNDRFGGAYRSNFGNVLGWLASADKSRFTTQNGLEWLFASDGSQWHVDRANQLIGALIQLDRETT